MNPKILQKTTKDMRDFLSASLLLYRGSKSRKQIKVLYLVKR